MYCSTLNQTMSTELIVVDAREEEDAAWFLVMQLARASLLPMVLKSAIELGVLEIISKAGQGAYLSASEIAAQLPSTNLNTTCVILDRVLRFLASHSVVTCTVADGGGGVGAEEKWLYGLAPVCKFLTKNADGVSLAPYFLLNQSKVFLEACSLFNNTILDGGSTFNMCHGMSIFEYVSTNPIMSKVFNLAMSDSSTITLKKILETYKGFEGLTSVVDVGGGNGAALRMIISKYPKIKGINFDLPHVIEDSPPYPGVEHVAGDMLTSIPKGDAILLKRVCHNWGDEQCTIFLRNCYDALPDNGKVIVAENLQPLSLDTTPASRVATESDVAMLVLLGEGAKERTEKAFETLAKGAGFQGFRVVCRAFNIYVMEFLKNV